MATEEEKNIDASDPLENYALNLSRGALIMSLVRSMKQNDVPKDLARQFCDSRGEDAMEAFREFFEAGSIGVTKAKNRDTIMVNIDPIVAEDVDTHGTAFDFSDDNHVLLLCGEILET
jgi:hypothetical protein